MANSTRDIQSSKIDEPGATEEEGLFVDDDGADDVSTVNVGELLSGKMMQKPK